MSRSSEPVAHTLRSRVFSGIYGRNAMSLLLATVGVIGLNALFHLVISRVLGPSQYGVLGAALSIVTILTVPMSAVQMATTQAVVRSHDKGHVMDLRRLVGRVLAVGLVTMALLAVACIPLDHYLHLTSPGVLLVVAVWVPFNFVGAVLQGALTGEFRFASVAYATFVGAGLLRLSLGIFLAVSGAGAMGAVAATLVGQIYATGTLAWSARHLLRRHVGATKVTTRARELLISGAALTGFTALTSVDTFLSRHLLSSHLAGEYAAGAFEAHIAYFLPAAIVSVAFPHLVSAREGGKASRRAFLQALQFSLAFGLLTAAGMVLFPTIAVHLLFGGAYTDAAQVLRPLAIESAGLGVLNVVIYLHIARRSWASLFTWLSIGAAVVAATILPHTMAKLSLTMLFIVLGTTLFSMVPALRTFLRTDDGPLAVTGYRINPGALAPDVLDVSLVIPFYNPGASFEPHVLDCLEVLSQLDVTYEVILVDDGSTHHISTAQLELNPRIKVIRYTANQGKGEALRIGLTEGHARYLGFIDADGDLPASLLPFFIDAMRATQPDIVSGSKWHQDSDIEYTTKRRIVSFVYRMLVKTLFRLGVDDTQTGIKFVRRDVLVAALPLMVERKFAFDLELFVAAKSLGYRRFVELPVTVNEQLTSTVSARSVIDTMLDTLAIFYRARFLRFYSRAGAQRSATTTLREATPGE